MLWQVVVSGSGLKSSVQHAAADDGKVSLPVVAAGEVADK